MQQIENTLYVMTHNAYIHLENEAVRVDVDHKERLRVPLHHLGSVVTFGNIMISPALMHRCAEDGISMVLLNGYGRFKARLEGPVSGNILLRIAQHQHCREEGFCLEIARTLVAGKVKNSRQILLRGAREASNEEDGEIISKGAVGLMESLRSLPKATTMEEVLGIEGHAARSYFATLSRLVRQDIRGFFTMNGRTRRPPQDAMNALLSFHYSLLMNDVRSALETVGLDPQLGFLHTVRPGRASLALDLMEEFRPYLADRAALTLINRGQVRPDDFEARTGGAVLLNEQGRKTVVGAYQERKQEEITHPLLTTRTRIGLLPFLQARLLARTIRGDVEAYAPFLVR
ncbi:MAG: type I-C CRISPR-associated endonuclease Cas1 [Magnetococcales bacterium]|nr:type I-C CRISPR-associated endonuclease Cas1 [Magnetococcales bacterium]